VTQRRPRNEISRDRRLAIRAAEIFDEGGQSFDAVAKRLSTEFKKSISRKTVGSWYKIEYQPVEDERKRAIQARDQVQMVLSAARDSGVTFAEASQQILAKTFYDLLKPKTGAPAEMTKELISIGKQVSKMMELENERLRITLLEEKQRAASAIKQAAGDPAMTKEDLVARVDELMGIKPRAAA
jgi:hypothetical protein